MIRILSLVTFFTIILLYTQKTWGEDMLYGVVDERCNQFTTTESTDDNAILYLPDTSDCSKYHMVRKTRHKNIEDEILIKFKKKTFQCSHQYLFTFSCPPIEGSDSEFLHWDATNQMCNWPNSANCEQKKG